MCARHDFASGDFDMTVRTQSAETTEIPSLSPAEQAVLPLLLAGDTERDIASALEKSTATVNKQVGSIFRAFGVQSKPQLIARHFELLARQNLSKNGSAGVNTP